jgi:dTDP-D-glucose 4,6-dehydratase
MRIVVTGGAGFIGSSFINYIKHGYLSSKLDSKLRNPGFIHNLYHSKDPGYMSFLSEFYSRYKNR